VFRLWSENQPSPKVYEREVGDLPWSEYRTTVVIELYRVRCPDCGIKAEKVPQLPSKAPFSKRFEEAVGLACESAAGRDVAQQWTTQQHSPSHRFALSEALGGGAKEASVAADGGG
jgi:transposase